MHNLEYMQTFIRIVDCGSLTKAAGQLNIAKSAVSRQLAELEKHCGTDLIIRTTRKQTLTKQGEYYYQQSLRIINDILQVEDNLRKDRDHLTGSIKISVPNDFGLSYLGAVLRKFNEINSHLHLEVAFDDRKVDLIEGGFDLAIRISRLQDSTLKARMLTSMRLVLVASPGYLQRYGTPKEPKDLLNGHVKLRYAEGRDTWGFTDSDGNEIPVTIPSVQTSNNANFLCESAIDGLGLLYIPEFIVHEAVKNKQLTLVLSEYLENNRVGVYAIYPQSRHLSQRVRSLVDFIVDVYSRDVDWRV